MNFESKKRDRDEFGPVSRGDMHLIDDGLVLGERPGSLYASLESFTGCGRMRPFYRNHWTPGVVHQMKTSSYRVRQLFFQKKISSTFKNDPRGVPGRDLRETVCSVESHKQVFVPARGLFGVVLRLGGRISSLSGPWLESAKGISLV